MKPSLHTARTSSGRCNHDPAWSKRALATPLGATHGGVAMDREGRAYGSTDGISAYDCMIASAESLYGPCSDRHLAIPHAGHDML
jgi:hypothetical protein